MVSVRNWARTCARRGNGSAPPRREVRCSNGSAVMNENRPQGESRALLSRNKRPGLRARRTTTSQGSGSGHTSSTNGVVIWPPPVGRSPTSAQRITTVHHELLPGEKVRSVGSQEGYD